MGTFWHLWAPFLKLLCQPARLWAPLGSQKSHRGPAGSPKHHFDTLTWLASGSLSEHFEAALSQHSICRTSAHSRTGARFSRFQRVWGAISGRPKTITERKHFEKRVTRFAPPSHRPVCCTHRADGSSGPVLKYLGKLNRDAANHINSRSHLGL